MAYKGVLDDVRTCLRGGVPKKMPVFAMSQVFDAVSAGYTYEEVLNDGSKLIDCVIKGIENYNWDWGWAPLDDSITFEPLGFEIGPKKNGQGNSPYIVKSHRPATYKTLKGLRIVDFQKEGRVPFLFDAIKALKRRFRDKVCVIGWVVGPMQCTAYVYGVANTLLLIYDDPNLLKDTLDFFVEQNIALADAEIESGADAIFIPDLLSASYFISPDQYQEFLYPALKKIFQHIHLKGKPVFFHPNEPRTDRILLMSSLGEISDIAITVGSEGNLIEAKEMIGNKVCLMGNVHCLQTLRNGTPESVKKEVETIIEQVSIHGGHIFNTCATMAEDTPPENARAMVNTVREHFGKRIGET
jgi:uroporphyrinogen decarboxylase